MEFSSKMKKRQEEREKPRQRKEFQVKLQSRSPLFQVPEVQGTQKLQTIAVSSINK